MGKLIGKQRKVELLRCWNDENQTNGILSVYDENGLPLFSSIVIERGWQNNKPMISSVAPGTYDLVLEHSPRFKQELWEIYGTEGRSECKIHAANHWHQLNGCQAPGLDLQDFDRDGYLDVRHSRTALDAFHRAMRPVRKATIEIIDRNNPWKS